MTYKVKLQIFEGPLDLLLYLIQKNELDIHDIPITLVTEQYLQYLNLMQSLNLDVAGEFLVMASMLMRIKSKMLLPPDEVPADAPPEEQDPRAELVAKLLEYMRYKDAAQSLRKMETSQMDSFVRFAPELDIDVSDSPFLEGTLFDLITAFGKVLQNMPKEVFHQVIRDEYTVAEKVQEILGVLKNDGQKVRFTQLFTRAANRLEAITVFLALLELIRMKEVLFMQDVLFDDIQIVRTPNRRQEELEMTAPPPAEPNNGESS
jgi:segregation and condensation protein A